MTSVQMMNFLFYVGVLVPTAITILLFLIFILCLKRIKARSDVIHKKHDPHGRMRELGLPMVPPLPPKFNDPTPQVNVESDGADNSGFHGSRSPSTETESAATTPGGTRLMYNACPDSGMSGLSEVTTCKDRPRSQASHSSTDSEDSGFRSSRSGNFPPSASHHDVPLLKPIKSHRDSVLSQSVRFAKCERTPAKNVSHDDLSINTPPSSSLANQNSRLNLSDIKVSSHLSWQYLQNLSSARNQSDHRPQQPLPGQQQTFTMAQIHQSVPKIHEHPETDFGFSVV